MKRSATAVILVLFASTVYAETAAEKKQMGGMIKELKALKQAGVSLHTRYKEPSAACVQESEPLRKRAAKLKGIVDQVDPYFRSELVQASDEAFQCVYCGDDGKACSEISSELKALQVKIAKSQQPTPRASAKDKW